MTQILALTGGVGGAKLAMGLHHVLPPGDLMVAVNTGADFQHLGMAVTPDLDTVMYALSDLANPELGWGRAGDTWNFMAEIERLGGESWFRIGDKELAVHIERTRRLLAGETLSRVTADIARHFGIVSKVVPMSNDPVRTRVIIEEGALDFQHYYSQRRCEPAVMSIGYVGAMEAQVLPEIRQLLVEDSLQAVIICPSNPWFGIAPILSMPSLREALGESNAPVIAVSPLINGQAVKGPTTKVMRELGLEVSSAAIAECYEGIIDGFVLDSADADQVSQIDVATHVTNTLMKTTADKQRLAREVLQFARSFRTLKLT